VRNSRGSSFSPSEAARFDDPISMISYTYTAQTERHTLRKYGSGLREGLFSLEEL
jgi:hypothetical protein